MCAASTINSAPTSSAIERNAAKSIVRGYAVAPATIIRGRSATRELADRVVVEGFRRVVHAVGDESVEPSAEVDR